MPQSQGVASHPNAASSGECLGVQKAARTEIAAREKEESEPKCANPGYRDKRNYQ